MWTDGNRCIEAYDYEMMRRRKSEKEQSEWSEMKKTQISWLEEKKEIRSEARVNRNNSQQQTTIAGWCKFSEQQRKYEEKCIEKRNHLIFASNNFWLVGKKEKPPTPTKHTQSVWIQSEINKRRIVKQILHTTIKLRGKNQTIANLIMLQAKEKPNGGKKYVLPLQFSGYSSLIRYQLCFESFVCFMASLFVCDYKRIISTIS